MSGPFAFPSDMMSFDDMLASVGGAGWDGINREFTPARTPQPFEPVDRLKKTMAVLYDHTPEGRAMVEWIFDLTFRAPYPSTGASFEQTALAAKAHEARAAVGRSIVLAILDGRKILETERSQTNVDTA